MYWIKKKEKKISLQRIFLCFGINSPFVKNEIVEREKLEKLSLSNKFWRLVYLVWTKILSREIGMFPRSPFLDPSFLTPIPQRKIKNKKIEKKGVPRKIPFREIPSVCGVYSFPMKWKESIQKKVATRNVLHGSKPIRFLSSTILVSFIRDYGTNL